MLLGVTNDLSFVTFLLYIRDLRKREVDQKGKTVIVVSHHPHNYMADYSTDQREIPFESIFTRLIVLAKIDQVSGATIVFDGSPKEARNFFQLEDHDPYSRIISKITPQAEGGEMKIDNHYFDQSYRGQ